MKQVGLSTTWIYDAAIRVWYISYKHKRWDAETSRINWFESNVISSHIELASEPQIVGDSRPKKMKDTEQINS